MRDLDIRVNELAGDVLSVGGNGPDEASPDEPVGQGDVDDDLLLGRLLLIPDGDQVAPPDPPDPPCNVQEKDPRGDELSPVSLISAHYQVRQPVRPAQQPLLPVGVRPEMSAEAGSTGVDRRTEESARAAENAFNDDDDDGSELPLLEEEAAEQSIVAGLAGFVINLDVGLMGLERFVGIRSVERWFLDLGGRRLVVEGEDKVTKDARRAQRQTSSRSSSQLTQTQHIVAGNHGSQSTTPPFVAQPMNHQTLRPSRRRQITNYGFVSHFHIFLNRYKLDLSSNEKPQSALRPGNGIEKVIKLGNNCKGNIQWDSGPTDLAHIDQWLNSGNHPFGVNIKDVSERRKINFKMAGTLIVHITHPNSNPGLSSCADKTILRCIPFFQTLHNLLNIFIVFLLSFLERLGLGYHIPNIDCKVVQEREGKDNKYDNNPSEIHQEVNQPFLSLRTKRGLKVRHCGEL
nr:hypothetical protein C4D60_Mb06t32300 [Ipomoea batatas]